MYALYDGGYCCADAVPELEDDSCAHEVVVAVIEVSDYGEHFGRPYCCCVVVFDATDCCDGCVDRVPFVWEQGCGAYVLRGAVYCGAPYLDGGI